MGVEIMTVPTLRAKLKEMGLPSSGNKETLLARLSEASEQQAELSEPRDASVPDSNSTAPELSEPQDTSVPDCNSTASDTNCTVDPDESDTTSTVPGGDYEAFKVQVKDELAFLRTTVENLCGTGNLVFGAVCTLDMLAEIQSLRRHIQERDGDGVMKEMDSLRREIRDKNSLMKEMESLRRQIISLEGQSKELDSLRRQIKEKDDIILALSEGNVPVDEPESDPATPPQAWYTVKAGRRRTGQAQNSWDPTFKPDANRFSPLADEPGRKSVDLSATPIPRNLATPDVRKPTAPSAPPEVQHPTPFRPPQAVCPPSFPPMPLGSIQPGHPLPFRPPQAGRPPPFAPAPQPEHPPPFRPPQAGGPPSFAPTPLGPPHARCPPQPAPRLKVTNPYPEGPGWQGEVIIPVKPGHKQYSKAHVRNILIETDSIGSGIRRQEIMADCTRRGMTVDISFRRQSGGQSHELHHHSKAFVADEKPHGLVVIAGTNDLPKRGGRRQLTDEEIANNLLAIGQQAKDLGVTNVLLCGITVRRGMYYQKRIRVINRLLKEGCMINGFFFIDNSNILERHTDGLHLTDEGSSILQNNIVNTLSCC